jgi:tRNA (guanine-N7-)-methyltransferase
VRRPPRLPPEETAPYQLAVPDPPAPLDWPDVFGNDNPVEVEVGSGKGLFLINASAERPAVNFLGVEIVRKYQLFTASRLARRGLKNVRVACADARALLRDCVREGSVQAVHVYFPDPWWKKRHHKRRVFTAEFVAACARVLRPGGRLLVVTDVEAYDGLVAELVAAEPRLRPVPPPEPGEPQHDLDYLTNFERKFRKQGKPIFRRSYERVKLPS